MRISYEWLSDFVDLDGVTPAEAAETLTRLGVEVESINAVDYSGLVVGKVIEQRKHPKSRDDLWIHQVDLGDRVEQIIAGRPNAGPGALVPVALPGTTVPNGKVVKKMSIAGEAANGMLCSAEELLLQSDVDGIHILEHGAPGQPLSEVLTPEITFDAEVTSNRPDCLGHLGVARELAAGLGRALKVDFMPAFTGDAEPPGTDLVSVTIDDTDLCSRYIGGVIKGVTVGPSPAWLQRRLRACGVRPINNIVDITNYVLLEYGQPLHAFDINKLGGREIRVRRARPGEKLLCLDGIERELGADMLVIADRDRPVAVAGVMGGEESAVTESTVDILVESATFNGPSVRQTARALGLRTEASARFEKTLPAELALAGARRAAALIAEIARGTVHRGWPDEYPRPQEPVRIRLRPGLVDEVLGTHVPLEKSESILKLLGFHVRVLDDGDWDVLPPVYRLDVTLPEDLIEEIGRVFGYDLIPPTLPGRRHDSWTPATASTGRRLDGVRQVLAGAGFSETWTPALVSGRELETLRLADRAMRVTNALSDDMDTLRTSLLGSLGRALALNHDRGRSTVRLYEIAAVFLRQPGGDSITQPAEPLRLGAVADAGPDAESGRLAFYSMKAILDACIASVGGPACSYEPGNSVIFHPGRCASVVVDGVAVGHVGELHPQWAAALGLAGRVAAIEIDLEPVLTRASIAKALPMPRFPAVDRDLAVVVSPDIAAGDLRTAIRAAGGDHLERVRSFDEYRGAQLGEGLKSVAFALTFRSPERTLTDAEVDKAIENIKSALQLRHHARFRE